MHISILFKCGDWQTYNIERLIYKDNGIRIETGTEIRFFDFAEIKSFEIVGVTTYILK